MQSIPFPAPSRRQAIAGLAGVMTAMTHDASADTLEARDRESARFFDTNRRFIATPQGEIAYVERGSGPATLFLHGFPLSSFQWRDVIAELAPLRRCLAPDFMGLGHTRVASGQSVAPAAQAEMLAAFLDRLGVASVDLVGNDSGGAVAQLFAIRHPGRVRTMLLTNCDVEPDSPPAALLPVIELAREGTYPDKWLVPWLRDKALARSKDGIGAMCYSDPRHPTDAAIEQYFGPILKSSATKALVNAYTVALDPNPLAGIEPKLRALQVPTRIVWGMADEIFSRESPDYLDRILPQSRGVRRVLNGKLFFPEEYPQLIAAEARTLWGA